MSQISPYLLKGQRDGAGAGPSFVGALDDTWMELATADRQTSAIEMLAALRLRGARNIMIYDSSHRVRLQALGEGDVHLPTTDLIAQ